MVEAIDWPFLIAHIEAPLPRWATITSSRAIWGAIFRSVPHDVFVGQAVEPVAPHALVVIGARQGERVVDEGMAAVERRVEAGDLRRSGKGRDRRLDAGEVVRLVQRRERDELAQLGEHGVVDQHRLGRDPGPPCTTRWPTATMPLRVADVLEPAENDASRRVMVERAGGRVEARTRSSRRSPA